MDAGRARFGWERNLIEGQASESIFRTSSLEERQEIEIILLFFEEDMKNRLCNREVCAACDCGIPPS